MSKIAFFGHPKRGNEIIQILQMLGGKDVGYGGYGTNFYYYIDEYDNTAGNTNSDKFKEYKAFTLEEFFEKYPYKVGNQVRVPEYVSEDGSEVQYEVVTDEVEWYSTKELNEFNKPDKEETDKAKAPNLIGEDYSGRRFGYKIPNGYEFDCIKNNEIILKYKQPQYPKTYDEWYNTDNTEWHEYVKIEKSEIFENLFKIIDKYNDDIQQLNDDTYLKLKNEIATELNIY